ncbi:MAG: glycosyltransferase, partial [Solirubrobacterales bacterium]|nr:glycosyltransferase [Solirubrobacterales bacterium]
MVEARDIVAPLTEVPLKAVSLRRFDDLLDRDEVARLHAGVAAARPAFEGRTVWNVNSTARGGGVAELLTALLALGRGAGVDARWLVVGGDEHFFTLTKRLHNRLHGVEGDGGPLGPGERQAYEQAIAPAATALLDRAHAGDVIILHDPQTAGMIPVLKAHGLTVVWRAHIGIDVPNDIVRSAWAFLAPYVAAADRCVFSRPSFAWDVVPADKRIFISPSIDPFVPKNQELDEDTVTAILQTAGLIDGVPSLAAPRFTRWDGSAGQVRPLSVIRHDHDLPDGQRYVLQVSRWDALKDPVGVVEGFAGHIAPFCDLRLVYAGPDVQAVTDDPEGAEVLAQVRAVHARLPQDVRKRIDLAMLPMDDPEENAAIVNALQRRATVVVQKSLAEGFGLTVSEAMWKGRPVVATALGGIQDQIEEGRSGILLPDARDLEAYGAAVVSLAAD